ncbi:MAG TPA: glycosyltransferase, partial [Gemmataceae bacterium]|nr:glycosyltransferase [Gemmataceae bacterium]
FANAYPAKLFTLISNAGDMEVLPRVSANFGVLPLYASQWVLPELFKPRPFAGRDVDLIMVANFAKVKRHHVLFAALRNMPARTRVLLVGQDQDGRDGETIRREAAHYGVADRLTIVSNAKYAQVTEALCRARASLILSRREGSCVVVAESLFANTPTALLQGAEIGSRAFVNPQTGVFLDERQLGRQLNDLIQCAESFAPRQWAEANISCHHSSHKLNEVLREHALATGQHWTQDIAPLCWRPDPRLVHDGDVTRLQAERLEMKAKFGLEVGPTPGS